MLSKYQMFKMNNHYRKAEDKSRSCKTCKWLVKIEYHRKNYYKCELIGISQSIATDIRLSYTCDMWNRENPYVFEFLDNIDSIPKDSKL